MLREIDKVRQVPGEPRRRWFTDAAMDLFVWTDRDGTISGFQLAYDKPDAEKAFTWRRVGGFDHAAVDDGARPGQHPASPLLVPDGHMDAHRLISLLRTNRGDVDPDIEAFIVSTINAYPEPPELAQTAVRPERRRVSWWIVLGALVSALVVFLLYAGRSG